MPKLHHTGLGLFISCFVLHLSSRACHCSAHLALPAFATSRPIFRSAGRWRCVGSFGVSVVHCWFARWPFAASGKGGGCRISRCSVSRRIRFPARPRANIHFWPIVAFCPRLFALLLLVYCSRRRGVLRPVFVRRFCPCSRCIWFDFPCRLSCFFVFRLGISHVHTAWNRVFCRGANPVHRGTSPVVSFLSSTTSIAGRILSIIHFRVY